MDAGMDYWFIFHLYIFLYSVAPPDPAFTLVSLSSSHLNYSSSLLQILIHRIVAEFTCIISLYIQESQNSMPSDAVQKCLSICISISL